MTTILKIMQPHVLSYWDLAARGNKTLKSEDLLVNKHTSHKMINYFV